MKKFFLGLFLLGFLAIPLLGLAQPVREEPPLRDVPTAVKSIIDWTFGILLLLAAFFIIVGGYYYVTAGGDATKIGVARNYLVYALVGVGVAFLARGLVQFINTVVQ